MGKMRFHEAISFLENFPNLHLEEIKFEIYVNGRKEFLILKFSLETGWIVKYKAFEARGLGPIIAINNLKKIDVISEELYDVLTLDDQTDDES